MALANRIRELRRSGLNRGATAVILGTSLDEVAAYELDPELSDATATDLQAQIIGLDARLVALGAQLGGQLEMIETGTDSAVASLSGRVQALELAGATGLNWDTVTAIDVPPLLADVTDAELSQPMNPDNGATLNLVVVRAHVTRAAGASNLELALDIGGARLDDFRVEAIAFQGNVTVTALVPESTAYSVYAQVSAGNHVQVTSILEIPLV